MISIGIWSQTLVPGKRARVHPIADFRLTSASFSDNIVDENGRTTIKLYRSKLEDEDEDEEDDDEDENKPLEFEDEPVCIASLIPGKIETQILDLVFVDDEPVEFEITGKNTVHLVGNFIDQAPLSGHMGEDEDEDDSDEEAYRIDEISSDVEVDPSELMPHMDMDDSSSEEGADDSARFEEVKELEKAVVEEKVEKGKDSKKRPRDSDGAVDQETEKPLTKAQQKKLNKKLKGEGGVAIPAGETEKPKEEKKSESKEKNEKKEDKNKKSGSGKSFKTDGGVEVNVATEGSGPQAKKGNTLEMRYIGKLQNGKVFDKNTSGKPFKFTLGKGEVIKGWDEGLVGMRVGGERVLIVPPELGYGKRKTGDIPANSTLRFEVKLLNIR